jgi:acyl transferase domain-containing protein/acyl carrier protein
MNNTEIIKKALIEIRELKSKFKKLQNQQTEPIAIIGMGCRFPGGADNLDSYWNLLHNGIDAISHVPEDRWNKDEFYDSDPDTKGKINNTFGGFLKSSIYDFDPRFFNISVQEAIQIDPQQRLLLEVVWETLENSNISPDDLFESLTGVFVGLSSFDYALRIFGSNEREQISPYSGSGALLSPPAGRISYLLGLKGPCMSVDTACSSASLAIHLASQSLRNRECNLALAGGINALLSPGMSIYFSTAGMLSSDGRCKTFDAAANGYVRSEGCGMIALKRLSDAEADNDTIYAIIKGSAVNQDGPGAGLTVPNGPSQEIVIKKALSFAQIKPDQVSYIEAHGTGTALGDPIEMRALSKVYCNNRSKDNTLWVGSVKTNLGHMEPAAGMASIIKIVLSMQHNEIPKNLHFRNPNPLIPFDEYPIKVPQKNVPWFSKENPRIAASSAFGFSGTNVHILVQEWPSIKTNTNIQNDRPVHLFVLSAKTNAALEQLAERYASHLSGFDDHSISNICFTANTCRKHFDKRMSIIAETTGQLISLLNSFLDGNISSPQLFTEHNFEPIDPFKEEWFEGIYDGQQNWNKAFSNIAKYYVNGGTINFKQLDQSYTRQKVNLPLYPFQRKRYEVKLQECGMINENNNHPLIGKRLMSPAFKNSIIFESIYSENTQFLKEHVIFNKMISPAAAHLSKVCSSVHEALGTSQLTVEDITFQIPLVVNNYQKKRVQIILEKQIDTPMPFQIISADLDTDDNWTVHCDGSVAAINTSGSTVISFDDIKNRCKHFKKGKEFYQDFINAGYELGPNYQRIVESYYGDGEAVCKLMLSSENTDEYIHPGLMDSIFQSGMFASLQTLKKIISSDTIYIPANIKSFTLYSRDFSQTIWTHAQTKTNDHSLETDITGINENGKLLFKVNRLLVKETDKKVLYKAISNQKELYYSIDWQENNLPETAHKQSCLYLIFADHNSPSSNRLFEYVKQHSLHYVMVFKSPEFKHINHSFEINPESKDHFNTLIKTITESNPTIPIQILYMWGFDLALTDTDRTNVLKEIIEHSCKSLLNLIQLMVNYEWNTFPQLWVLTNNACQTGDTSTPIEISQSSLLGMGKIMALEHPELWGGNIDIQMSEQSIETLFNEMSLDEHINDPVAIRNNGKSYSAKLKEIRLNKQTSPIIIKPNATYLITGGLGSLGLITAKWLIDKGAKHILLSGRKGPGPDIKEKIVLMTKDDVHIDTQQLDVSDLSSISNAFEQIKQTMPPLKGIIHSAGVLDDGAITFQNWKRFHKVIAPKIYGAWNLHTLTQTMDIDFFILFSSVVSTMGNPGQSNYAAANAFLDGLAHYRKSKQLPVTCINWGPWDTEGMAGGNETIRDIFHANGFQLINPESGIDALDRIVSEKLTQIAVINCQFKKFLDQNSVKKYGFYSLLTDVQAHMTLPDPLKKPEKSALFLKLEAASSDERLDILEHYIKNKIVQLMGLDSVDEVDSRKRLFDLGIDSLMAVELRNHFKAILGIPLSSTLLFDYPTIEALLHYLIEALNFETQEEITQPETLESNQRINIENLSEDEAEKLLLEALEMSDDL